MNVTLTENQESQALPLTQDDLEYLNSLADKRPLFVVRWNSKGIHLTPDQIVGNLTLPSGLRLLIKPKMSLGSIMKMLSYVETSYQPFTTFSAFDEDDELFSLLARLFAEETEKVLQKGLLQTHQPEVQVLGTIKGRILMKESMSTLPHQQLVCSSFNLTANTLENRIVVTALELLLRTRTGSSKTLAKMQSIRLRLPTSIQPLTSLQDFQRLNSSRHNEHYRRVIYLANLILRHIFFQQEFGQLTQPCFLVNMANLFERYVARSLIEASPSFGVRIIAQTVLPLDRKQQINMRPDLRMMSVNSGEILSILDTKYKNSLENGKVVKNDIYQMLSYMIASDSRESWLVYPCTFSHEATPNVAIEIPFENHIFRIHQIGFDVVLTPQEAGSSLLTTILNAQEMTK